PRPSLPKENRSDLVRRIRVLGPHNVILKFSRAPYTHAPFWAIIISDVFRDANWHIEQQEIASGAYPDSGVVMETDNFNRPSDSLEFGVETAFRSAGIPVGAARRKQAFDGVIVIIGEAWENPSSKGAH